MKNSVKLITVPVLAALAFFAIPVPMNAEVRTSLNLSGQAGLIDMPSGEQLPDAILTYNYSRFGSIERNALRFQIAPRLSATFRYVGIHDWNSKVGCPPCTGVNQYSIYYDRNFDLSYQVLLEGRYVPAVSIGLQDFIGTGLNSGEYIAATKNIGERFKVTAGLGFGSLGSYNSIGQPFGPRDKVKIGQGGNINASNWFRGDAAFFGGVEYAVNDQLTLKAEYSSDAYNVESAVRGTFDRKSPLNFGVEYQPNSGFRLGGYYMYGSEFGINLTLFLNAKERPFGGMGGPAPEPVKVRPSRQTDSAAWATGWTEVADAKSILIGTLQANLANAGVTVESLGFTATTAQVRFRNNRYDAPAQAIGRVARAMSQAMPASVEIFELVPVDHGMPAAMVTIRRSDLENLEFAPDAGAALRAQSTLSEADYPLGGIEQNPTAYPRLTWSILPYARTLMFGPSNPLQAALGLSFNAQYELTPNLILSGSIAGVAWNNIDNQAHHVGPGPYVRSDAARYYANGNPYLQTLNVAWYKKLAPELYGRITVGYLEQMYAGISSQILWRKVNSPFALGFEADYVAQRNTDGGFGFDEYNYSTATGRVTGYYDFGKGYTAQLDVGRYLAGDVGATLSLSREFANGWRVGAFATKTNMSAAEFGEGSFDKGITLQIPVSWLSNRPSRTTDYLTFRPVRRDGGASVDEQYDLYQILHSYDEHRIDDQWGRVWK